MFQLLLVVAILVYTQAIVCPPNYCNSVDCQDVSTCNGVLQKGFCGCCDICATVINMKVVKHINQFRLEHSYNKFTLADYRK
ncbi:hypothetical protein CHS0354_016573 [Potamilus streckersoni]|uniref:Uncharacterized protein n=1 Tax=Potamilus streckersoni TaxID=2493646 RepID=A0AAE0TKJ6_9BIVA|nr:hypothetical protein CHS0354_016573 [Potamilus streckersoni]